MKKFELITHNPKGWIFIKRKVASCSNGQAIVEYMMLVALVVGMISFVIATFGPQKERMAGALRDSMERIISNGSIDNDHPLRDYRVRDVD